MKSIRIFLLKGKESMIDHVKSIQTLGCAYWKKARNKNLQVGDICYLYLIGKGHYQIRFRLEVVDISCDRLSDTTSALFSAYCGCVVAGSLL